MSFKNSDLAEKSFNELSNSITESEELMIETRILMYRFLSEIDKITSERRISRKELAKLTGTSASYITQLFQGKKIINLQMLTKIKKALDIDFKIKVVSTGQDKKSDFTELSPIVVEAALKNAVMNVPVQTLIAAGLIRNKKSKTLRKNEG